MTEKEIINQYLLKYSEEGHRLWRNNTGMAYQGIAHYKGRNLTLTNYRPLHAGLCQGSSDLIGLTQVTITPEMVGQKIAVFTAIEIKAGKTRSTWLQENFVKTINKLGGIGKIVRGPFEKILKWEDMNE